MTAKIKHKFPATGKVQSADPSIVSKDAWLDDHDVTILDDDITWSSTGHDHNGSTTGKRVRAYSIGDASGEALGDGVNDFRASKNSTANTCAVRDASGNLEIQKKINFNDGGNNYNIVSDGSTFNIKRSNTTLVTFDVSGSMTYGRIPVSRLDSISGTNFTMYNGETLLTSANVNAYIPTGTIQMYAGNTSPNGWLLCNGQRVNYSTYTTLYNFLNSNGWPNLNLSGSPTKFTLPNFQRRVPMGSGGTQIQGPLTTLGSTGGVEQQTLLETNMPSTHKIWLGPTGVAGPGAFGVVAQAFVYGDGTPFEVVQPSLVVNFIIRHGN